MEAEEVTHGHEAVVLAAAWPTAPVAGNAISAASAAAPPAAAIRHPPGRRLCFCCRLRYSP
jgi:hypothetical protein